MTEETNQVPTCRVCGCTDDDCRQCIEATGVPCSWVEPGLCSACAGKPYPAAAAVVFTFGNDSRQHTMTFEVDVIAGKEQRKIKRKFRAIMKKSEWFGTRIRNLAFARAAAKPQPEPEALQDGFEYADYDEVN